MRIFTRLIKAALILTTVLGMTGLVFGAGVFTGIGVDPVTNHADGTAVAAGEVLGYQWDCDDTKGNHYMLSTPTPVVRFAGFLVNDDKYTCSAAAVNSYGEAGISSAKITFPLVGGTASYLPALAAPGNIRLVQ